MPGHTRGCLAWSTTLKEEGKSYYTFIECSLNGQFLQVLDNYPGMIDDFRATYKKARTFPVEVWVSSHRRSLTWPRSMKSWRSEAREIPIPLSIPRATRLTWLNMRRASRKQ